MDAPFTDHLTPLRRLYLVDDNEDGTAEARDNDRPRREALTHVRPAGHWAPQGGPIP